MKTGIMRLAYMSLVSATALMAASAPAYAQQAEARREFNIPAQPLASALNEFSRQSDIVVTAPARLTRQRSAPAVRGSYTPREALRALLTGSGLQSRTGRGGTFIIEQGAPASGEALAGGAAADSGSADEREIIVTGTNIVGQRTSSSPLQVLNRQEINRTGATSVFDVLSRVTSNSGLGINVAAAQAGVNNQNANTNRGRASAPNLRGLGSNSTLVLLNGNRLPIASEGYSVDISVIPLAAVERIDILTDGASAIYGSDAVAGVINVLTRRDFDGAETTGTFGTVTEGGKLDFQLSQLFGRNWGSGNAMASYTFDDQDPLPVGSRDFSRNGVPGNFLISPSRSHSGYTNLRQDIGQSLEANVDVLFNHRRTITDSASLSNNASSGVPVGQPIFSTGTSTNQTLLSSASLRRRFGDNWYATLAGTYTWNRTFSQGFSITNPGNSNRYTGENWSVEASTSGSPFTLPGGAVLVAFGALHRHETFATRQRANFGNSDFVRSRDVQALYGEVSLPLVGSDQVSFIERLIVDASVRYEHDSDFGSTTNPKFGAALYLPGGFRLRSTYSTSFLAPSLAQLSGATFTTLQFRTDPFSPTGNSITLERTGANLDLEPQTSDNWTAGIDWMPDFADLTVSVDYYDVRFDGLITRLAPGSNIRLQPDIYGAFLTRNPSTALTLPLINGPNFVNNFGPFVPEDIGLLIDTRLQNVSELETNGIDARIDYRHAFPGGTLSASINLTKILEYRLAAVAGQPLLDVLDTVSNPASFRGRARLGWDDGTWALNAYLNHVGGYADETVLTDIRPVRAWNTVDFQVEYRSPAPTGPLAGLRIAFTISNLFDEDPPFVLDRDQARFGTSGINYDPVNASPLGRYLSLRVSKSW